MRQYKTKKVQIEQKDCTKCICDWCKEEIIICSMGYRQDGLEIEINISESNDYDGGGWRHEYDLCRPCWDKLAKLFNAKPREIDW